jgi:hypothetical protein
VLSRTSRSKAVTEVAVEGCSFFHLNFGAFIMTSSVKDIDFKAAGEFFPSPRDWRDVFIYFLLVDGQSGLS